MFTDSYKTRLKCVLLSNGNQCASILIVHSVFLKKNYETMAMVSKKIMLNEQDWPMCGDIKVISTLPGQQSGNTKHPCFDVTENKLP